MRCERCGPPSEMRDAIAAHGGGANRRQHRRGRRRRRGRDARHRRCGQRRRTTRAGGRGRENIGADGRLSSAMRFSLTGSSRWRSWGSREPRRGVPPARVVPRRRAARAAPRDTARRRARAAAALARLPGRRRRSHMPSLHPPRPRRHREVAARRRLRRAGGRLADVLRGRCLSYGEGITYWPLAEILIAIGVEPGSVIGSVAAGDAARVPEAARGTGRRAPAGRRDRRPAVGGARVRRSRGARRRPLPRRAHLPPLHRANRAPRRTSRAGRREAQRDVASPRAARCRRVRGADDPPGQGGRGSTPVSATGSLLVGRESPLRRRDARDGP